MPSTHVTSSPNKSLKPRGKSEPIRRGTNATKTKSSTSRIAGPALSNNPVVQEARHHMIAEAAYFLAERRGFENGDPVEDWLEAEAQVDRHLTSIDEIDNGALIAGIDRRGGSIT